MASNKWRGFAAFQLPENTKEVLMTVCPGNPDQEGARFNAIMEAAGASSLDRLIIIEAGDLGTHNLKRFVPRNEAAQFARVRGEKWQADHKPIIDSHMKGRCHVIPMRDIVSDSSFQDRVRSIRKIYDRGENKVTRWFNDSANYNNPVRMERFRQKGVLVQEWALKEDSLDYLCDEYAMRSLMWKKYGLDEIYLGRAVALSDFFQSENAEQPDIDLTIPPVIPIEIWKVEMVHDRKSGRSTPSAGTENIPSYAKNIWEALPPSLTRKIT